MQPACVVVVVTGPPASGKSTIARRLARDLHLPFFSKDQFKETLFDTLGWRDRDWSRSLGSASLRLLFQAAATLLEAHQSLILESNFKSDWDTRHFERLAATYGCTFVQVVCTAPPAVLVARYEERVRSGRRHPSHVDAESAGEWRHRLFTERWDALDLGGASVQVDTTRPVDFPSLLSYVSRELRRPHPTGV